MTSNQHCLSVPQCSLWKCQTSSFHLREILSDLLSPLPSSAEASVCTGPCFIWISKPMRRWPDTLNAIFWGFSQGMWLPKCPWRRNLITETMWALWRQGDGNLYLLSALETRWTQKRLFASQCAALLGSTLKMAFEKSLAFLAVNPRNRDGEYPDMPYM